MPRKLVLAGGGHAHMMTLAALHRFVERGHQVTVVQPSDFHYYSGMGPGMLGGSYAPSEIRFATRRVVEKQGGTFLRDKVIGIDPEACVLTLASGATLPYDVLSCNTGSSVPQDILAGAGERVFTVKPIERLDAARRLILQLAAEGPVSVGVVGGGPSAVEIAGNADGLARRADLRPVSTTIYARSTLMAEYPEGVRRKARRSLQARGIKIMENAPIAQIGESGSIKFGSGGSRDHDLVFIAVGVRPSPFFRECGLTTGLDGGMAVNRWLQSVDYPNIFGGGDCIHFQEQPLDKVGVYAVRENPVLLHNLGAAMDGGDLMEFEPGGDYLLIFNMGDGTGILRKRFVQFGGRLAFRIKDWIDRRFMRQFQAIES